MVLSACSLPLRVLCMHILVVKRGRVGRRSSYLVLRQISEEQSSALACVCHGLPPRPAPTCCASIPTSTTCGSNSNRRSRSDSIGFIRSTTNPKRARRGSRTCSGRGDGGDPAGQIARPIRRMRMNGSTWDCCRASASSAPTNSRSSTKGRTPRSFSTMFGVEQVRPGFYVDESCRRWGAGQSAQGARAGWESESLFRRSLAIQGTSAARIAAA
jgi:hypothetical protein